MYIQPIYFNPSFHYNHSKIKDNVFTPEEPLIRSSYNIEAPLDTLQAYSNVSFCGYPSEMKRLYKKGKLKIKYSFYGGLLNRKEFSTDHIIPASKGGASKQYNYVFCNAWQNSNRGNFPLENYIDWKAAGIYFDQFKGVKVGMFDGDEYIKQALNSINEALKSGR